MRANWGDDNDNFFNFFGLPEHDHDQQLLNVADSGQRGDSS